VALAVFRVLLLAALPYEALFRYGDYEHFYNLAEFTRAGSGGLPFIDHWVEFPPLFPYLSLVLHGLTGGTEHLYSYSLAILMTVCDVANVFILARLAERLLPSPQAMRVAWVYAAFLALPAFGWWTFEPLAVLAMLLTLEAVVTDRALGAGVTAGLGVLTKIVPGAALAVGWRFWPVRRAALATAAAALVVVAGLLPFLALRPEMAVASLRSQASKGSWETIWALVDGNLDTGRFGPLGERLDPALATMPRGQPSRIPHWIPTVIAVAFGLWAFFRVGGTDRGRAAPLLGFLLSGLFLWSKGWSPQWLAYLIPILLISLPFGQALGFGLNLVAISLVEWPLLLTRGRFDLLWVPVVIRTALILLLAFVLARNLMAQHRGAE
jgi:hypothetical protein